MGWFTSGSSCRGNKRYECTYEIFYGDPQYGQTFCRDLDYYCPSFDDNAGLIKIVDHQAGGGGDGGGW